MKSAWQIDICFKIEALFNEEACEEWIGYYGWPICGVWHWPQRESHVGMLTQHEVFFKLVFRLPRIQIKTSLEVEINTKVALERWFASAHHGVVIALRLFWKSRKHLRFIRDQEVDEFVNLNF